MAENIPQSTVSQPVQSDLGADKQKLDSVIQKVGYAPRNQDELNMFQRMAYTPDELNKLGLDKDYQSLKSQTIGAREQLQLTPPPTNSGLRVLQDALNKKSNVTNQPLGESELYKKAGIDGGYNILRQSMNERAREMNFKYDSFKNTVVDTASGMVDTYNLALGNYTLLKDELDVQDQKMQTMLDEAADYERLMNQLAVQHQYDLEIKRLSTEFEDKYVTPEKSNIAANNGGIYIGGEEIKNEYTQSLNSLFGIGEPKGWCGVWASTLSTARSVGNSWTEKKQRIDSQVPTVGSKLLIPLGVTDGKGYGHVATVIGYNQSTGDIMVVESNRDGRMNKNVKNLGIATVGVYNLQNMQNKYGKNWGFASGELKPKYKEAEKYAMEILNGGAIKQVQGPENNNYQEPEGTMTKNALDMFKKYTPEIEPKNYNSETALQEDKVTERDFILHPQEEYLSGYLDLLKGGYTLSEVKSMIKKDYKDKPLKEQTDATLAFIRIADRYKTEVIDKEKKTSKSTSKVF